MRASLTYLLILLWKKFLCVRNIKSLEGAIRVARRHVTKNGQLRPSVGLYIACELERDPASHPGVHVDPVLALQAFLCANRSPLIIDHMYDRENAFVFRFAEQHISLPVKQIARQKYLERLQE